MSNYNDRLPCTSNRLSNFDRVKVDEAKTSFWEGREFRTFRELSIPTASSYVIKAVVPVNIVLTDISVTCDEGWLRLGTYAGGVEGGPYSDTLPRFCSNNMTVDGFNHRGDYSGAVYVSNMLLTGGGTHTGGVELDVIRTRASSNLNQGSGMSTNIKDPRGVGPGTYYFRLTNLDNSAVSGVFSARWEERPSSLGLSS